MQKLPTLVSRPDGQDFKVVLDGTTLLVRNGEAGESSRWRLARGDKGVTLSWSSGPGPAPRVTELLAALEGSFSFLPQDRELLVSAPCDSAPELLRSGVLIAEDERCRRACRDMLWQQARLWLPAVYQPCALHYAMTEGRRHPRRPPKRSGVLYQRFIPWLGKTFSFRALDLEADLPLVHRWMNDPAVAAVWKEEGDEGKHRAYLKAITADPHMQSMMATLDGEPFGYFETYWAKENRLAPFYDVHDFDRGWHVLIGEPSFRGKAVATAWLTSISHYIFLDDPRTQRAVGEPRADHERQIRNLDKSGYAKLKEFDFPHKRALLVMLLRERYFADALWWPRSDDPTARSSK